MKHTTRRTWSSWIAILAILLNALMPVVSQALPTGEIRADSTWSELCASDGSRWIRTDAQGHVLEQVTVKPANAPEGLPHFTKCQYCLTHSASFALPPPTPAWAGLIGGSGTFIPSDGSSLPALQVSWAIPAVRAPPRR